MSGDPRERVDIRTLEMLVCPITKTRLTLSPDRSELISTVGRRAFPIRKGVPLLVIDASRVVTEEEIECLKHNRPYRGEASETE